MNTVKFFFISLLCGAAVFANAQSQRPSLAVTKAKANTTMMENFKGKEAVSAARITEALDGHLITAIVASKRYAVVGRDSVPDVFKELEFIESGLVNADGAPKMGNIKAAQYILVTTLDHFLESEEKATFDGVTKIKRRYQVSGQTKIINVETTEIIDASNIQTEKVDIVDALSGANDGSSRLSALLPEITRDFAEKTVSRLLAVTYPAKVLRVSGKVLDINQGEGFFKKGDLVDVYGEDEVVIDEDSGEEFRLTGDILGTATITMVSPTTSKATYNGKGEVTKGARVMKK